MRKFHFLAREVGKEITWNSVLKVAKECLGQDTLDLLRWPMMLVHIYGQVKEKLTQVNNQADREQLLNVLQNRLMNELKIEEGLKPSLVGDFGVYAYFLQVRLTPLNEALPELDLNKLWAAEANEINPLKRYQDLIHYFLSELVLELRHGAYKNFKEIQGSLDAFNALSRLHLAKTHQGKEGIR